MKLQGLFASFFGVPFATAISDCLLRRKPGNHQEVFVRMGDAEVRITLRNVPFGKEGAWLYELGSCVVQRLSSQDNSSGTS